MKTIKILFFFLCGIVTQAFSQLADCPEAITNTAICGAKASNGKEYAFVFGGIDNTKIWSGIHKRCYRYDIGANTWEAIADLDDTQGKIASAASVVKDTVYIIGGYYVASNGNETSSNKVHRYNVNTNTYLSNGTNIPVAIDDHVQAVWRDSLIYVVTGWSNTANVPNVQIYNPSYNTWQVGTPVPNDNFYKAFGASGIIIGDTIWYQGGASMGTNFPATSYLRKGVIDPLNPSSITWSYTDLGASCVSYRTACTRLLYWDQAKIPFWIGGSSKSYNYNGIAYDGSGGVIPRDSVVSLKGVVGIDISIGFSSPSGLNIPMDLRGIATNIGHGGSDCVDANIIIGGMNSNQEVIANKTVWLNNCGSIKKEDKYSNILFPNPTSNTINLKNIEFNSNLSIASIDGSVVFKKQIKSEKEIDVSNLSQGIYFLQLEKNGKISTQKFIKQ